MAIDINKMLEMSRKIQLTKKKSTPLLFVGAPGLGKTANVRWFAEQIGDHLGVMVLGTVPSVDIMGMLVPDTKEGVIKHLLPEKLMGKIAGAEGKNICLFLDELGNSSEEQQSALLTAIEDGIIAGHKMPDNIWWVFATNPEGSDCGSNGIIKSLQDRLTTVKILSEQCAVEPAQKATPGMFVSVQQDLFPKWMDLAVEEWDIHPYITGYLSYKKGENFHSFDPDCAEEAQPSPRSWEKLSHILWEDPGPEELPIWGSGTIGQSTWAEFWGWVQLGQKVPTYDQIVEDFKLGNESHVPPGNLPDHQYAVIMNIAQGVRRHGSAIGKPEVDAVLAYLRKLPDTFAAYGWKVCNKNNPDFSGASSEVARFTQDYGHSIR